MRPAQGTVNNFSRPAARKFAPGLCKEHAMGVKIAKTTPKSRHYIREWRKARRVTQERLADMIGTTSSSVSRIETGEQPYSQDSLELIAQALNTTPGDLLKGPPGTADQPTVTHPDEPDAIDPGLMGSVLAGLFQKIGGLGETEAVVLAQAALEVARMPSEQLAAGADLSALAEGIASFARRVGSSPKRQ